MNTIITELKKVGVTFTEGLTPPDFRKITDIYGITFPEIWQEFYSAALPVAEKTDPKVISHPTPFPIWNDYSTENVERIKKRINAPYKWLLNDILISFDENKNVFWPKEWGSIPETKEEATSRFNSLTESAPTLIPVCSHRYVLMLEGISDPPVISSVGRDTVIYGKNFLDYILNEFLKPEQPQPIPFWNDII